MLIPDSKEAGFDVVCKPARACVCMCFVCACGNVHLCVLYVCVHIEMSISGVFPSLFTLVFATETLLERGIHQFSQPACLKDLSASASLAQELLLAQSPSFVRGHWVQKLDPHVFFFCPKYFASSESPSPRTCFSQSSVSLEKGLGQCILSSVLESRERPWREAEQPTDSLCPSEPKANPSSKPDSWAPLTSRLPPQRPLPSPPPQSLDESTRGKICWRRKTGSGGRSRGAEVPR